MLQANALQVKPANLQQVLAWKEGYFALAGTDIKSVMRQIARWYDVEIVYQGNFKGDDFAGQVSRSEPLSKVLQMLEMTGVVHFSVHHKTITVTQ